MLTRLSAVHDGYQRSGCNVQSLTSRSWLRAENFTPEDSANTGKGIERFWNHRKPNMCVQMLASSIIARWSKHLITDLVLSDAASTSSEGGEWVALCNSRLSNHQLRR